MVRITEQLIRKKSEHNELIIGTLEELSLHQEDIEKIEHVQNWCRNLKILLLQNNLIGRIENVSKLKQLEYLNLALNNVERIENVDGLEALEKLDLTLNFIGHLTSSVDCLRGNYNLRNLILTGNPCCDYEGYRDYVITVLPQLQSLDGAEITRTDRIVAKQDFAAKRRKIVQLEAEYGMRRDEQKLRVQRQRYEDEMENCGLNEDEISEKFWKKTSEHCPETRIEIAKQHRKSKNLQDDSQKKPPPPKQRKFFANCGRPYSINEAKLEFQLLDEPDRYELNLEIYKYLDTSLVEVDVQINYVRISVKKKIFQIALSDEVHIDRSTSKRSTITGHLLLTMPKLNYKIPLDFIGKSENQKTAEFADGTPKIAAPHKTRQLVDYKNIVQNGIIAKESPILDDLDEIPPLI